MPEALLLVGDSYCDQDLFYTTHFLAGDTFVYVEHNGRSLLVTTAMETGRAHKESSVGEVRSFQEFGLHELAREHGSMHDAFAAMLVRIVREIGGERVRAGSRFRALYADRMRAAGLPVQIDPTVLVQRRRHKTAGEIRAIEEVQRATEHAMSRAVELLAASDDLHGVLHYGGIPLTSERLRAEIETVLLRANMETSHAPIVAGGPEASDPHWGGTGPLRSGQAIVLDIFPRGRSSRYYADMTRTVVKGEPDAMLHAMYAAVLQAQETALSLIRPGVNGREVNEAVRGVFRRAGFDGEGRGARFTTGTGHGVGLDIHEPPSITEHDDELREGDVVTVEPGLYDPDLGAIRLEDMVLVTADGSRNLTQFPKRFEL